MIEGIKEIPNGANLPTNTQTSNENFKLIRKLGFQAPATLLGKLVWTVPTGQLLDSFNRLPIVGEKSPGISTWFGFDSRLLVKTTEELRFVPGRYGVASAVKLEGAPTNIVVAPGFGPDFVGIDSDWVANDLGRVTGTVSGSVQRLNVTAGLTPAGVYKTTGASNVYTGKGYSISLGALTLSGAVDTVRTIVKGFRTDNTQVYEQVYTMPLVNQRYLAVIQTPSVIDFGNLIGYTGDTVDTVEIVVEYMSMAAFVADMYGVQIEEGFATSLSLDTPRGFDRWKYLLPDITPASCTLTFRAKFPKQSTSRDCNLIGIPGGSFRLRRLAATPAGVNDLRLELKTTTNPVVFTFTPTTSFLDEGQHVVVLSLAYQEIAGSVYAVVYFNVDGEDFGPNTDPDGRKYFVCSLANGNVWDTSTLLYFSDGDVFSEIENPALFGGVLDLDEIEILNALTVPIQVATAPPALANSSLSPWQLFNVIQGVDTSVTLNSPGLRLADVLVDDVPQYEGENYHYDPTTGIVDFNHVSLPSPAPIDGTEVRIRHLVPGFVGEDAMTLNGRQGISAVDPRIGTAAAANMYLALGPNGTLPYAIGIPAQDLVQAAQLGVDVATLVNVGGERVLTPSQRPKATGSVLGMVKVGAGLVVDSNGVLSLAVQAIPAAEKGQASGVAALNNQGELDEAHRPVATAGELGMVRAGVNTGVIIDPDGTIHLATNDQVLKSEKGPLPNVLRFRDLQVATLDQFAFGPGFQYLLSPEARPIARAPGTPNPLWNGLEELGMVKVGSSLAIDANGVLTIARLGLAMTGLGLPGVATLDTSGQLTESQRPVASTTVRGMAKVGYGLGMGVVSNSLEFLDIKAGAALGFDVAGRLRVNIGFGLELDGSNNLKVAGAGFVPMTSLASYLANNNVDPATVRVAELEDYGAGNYRLRQDQMPVASNNKVGGVKVSTDASSNMEMSGTGVLSGKLVPELVYGDNEVAEFAGMVVMADPKFSGLEIFQDQQDPLNPYNGTLRALQQLPDYAEFNARQERNLAASLVGKWVTYVRTFGDIQDYGSYVDAIEYVPAVEVPIPQAAYWSMTFSSGDVGSYKNLTNVLTDNGRGYVVSGTMAGAPAATADRITSLGATFVVTAATNLFMPQSAGAGILEHAYIFGGSNNGTPSSGIVKISSSEVFSQLGAVLAGGGRRRPTAATVGAYCFIAGGHSSGGTTGSPTDNIMIFQGFNETIKTTGNTINLSAQRAEQVGLGFPVGAFFVGGSDGSLATKLIDKIMPDGSTRVALATEASSPLQQRRSAAAGTIGQYGYIGGGVQGSSGFVLTIERLDSLNPLTNFITQVSLKTAGATPVGVSAVSTGSAIFFAMDDGAGNGAGGHVDKLVMAGGAEAVSTIAAVLTTRRIDSASTSVTV